MKTFDERRDMVLDMLTDPELNLTKMDVLMYIFNWMRYELAVRRCIKATRARKKHSAWLNNTKDIYVLRKEMNKL